MTFIIIIIIIIIINTINITIIITALSLQIMVDLKEISPASESGRVAESIISECGKNALYVARMP